MHSSQSAPMGPIDTTWPQDSVPPSAARAVAPSLWQQMRPAVYRFLGLSLFLALAAGVIHFEVVALGSHVPESSLIEYMQESLLALIVGLFGALAYRRPDLRGFAVLVGGFFLCLLIRELDQLFDAIYHGAWKVPAYTVAFAAIYYAVKHRDSSAQPLVRYTQHQSFGLMLAGMALLMVFSRLFGMGVLWDTLMGEQYVRGVKSLAEEGTELAAYSLIFCAALWYVLEQLKSGPRRR
ncbi:transporter [Ferrimonas balearica]|uniref:transporter n=1 Tax=Ferrimonas balearica TaxID=44012 RepID=UPI001C99DC11|nr:transporter [Ferrimonas balearica]MBY5990689.1 transporter [Ferrimonas balearica]